MDKEYVARSGRQLAICLKVLYMEGVKETRIEIVEIKSRKLNFRVIYEADQATVDKIENLINAFTS